MATRRLIPLIALLAATAASGAPPTAGEAIVGEVLQVEITVEPERIAHHLQGSEAWVAAAQSRPQTVAPIFPGVPLPSTATVEEPTAEQP